MRLRPLVPAVLALVAAVAPLTAQTPAAPPAGTPPQGAPRRPPPDPRVQDSIRKVMVARVLETIKGREGEPAGKVFQNVKVLGDVPAGDFLKAMDEQYGRGLGMVCSNCHVPNEWAKDDKKNKVLARQMQKSTFELNERIAKMEGIDADFPRVTCYMCHRGKGHPDPQPLSPPVTPAPAPTP